MENIILCDVTASVSELKNDPVATAYPVAIIDRNRPFFFIVCPQLCMNKCSICWTKKTWRN